MKQLPKTVYVKREKDGDMSYFIADENLEALVNDGEEITTIGEYKLVEKKFARRVVELV